MPIYRPILIIISNSAYGNTMGKGKYGKTTTYNSTRGKRSHGRTFISQSHSSQTSFAKDSYSFLPNWPTLILPSNIESNSRKELRSKKNLK